MFNRQAQPPRAAQQPHRLSQHGDERTDEYYWLRQRDNPQVLAYLEAENSYLQQTMQPLEGLQEELFQEIVSHIQQSDLEVPVQNGPYFYYSRTQEGAQYRIYARKKAAHRAELETAAEEVILDLNTLAQGKTYLSVTVAKPSPDHRYLAYLQNEDGSDRYTLYIKDLHSGALLPQAIENVYLYSSLEWGANSQELFYVTLDHTQRPFALYRHRLDQSQPDERLLQEDDPTFVLVIEKTRSGQFLLVQIDSTLTSEVWTLDLQQPSSLRCAALRERGVKYTIEHFQDSWLMLCNRDALNFKLLQAPLAAPQQWSELLPHHPQRYLMEVYPFPQHLLIYGRQGGLSQIWCWHNGQLQSLSWPEPVYSVSLGQNPTYDTQQVLLVYQSLLTPKSVLELDLGNLQTTLLKQDPVPAYDPQNYTCERVWATARDGQSIPLSLVYRKDLSQPAPLYLYAYGSYGANTEPTFSPQRLVLLDRGFVLAIAHVRGGAEMGRGWYESGKLLSKVNTFTDFIDSALHLVQANYTTPQQLVAMGGSAGGLLMGAIVNMRPDLFRAVVAHVPFVDVVTTMLDSSIPLTTLEWDEWGNPAQPNYYRYMKAYSPYDNVEAKDYPHLLVTTGLNDPRVAYWEPAKWVARLRERKTDSNVLLLKTHMGAGHGGSSGRYDRYREIALEYAFLLAALK